MRVRHLAAFAVALMTAASVAAVPSPGAAQAQPNASCGQALAYEKTAANDSISRQAAYDSAVAGLSANQRCNDAQMKLVNEAYLLSMRAASEHELKVGNWQRDLTRANMLLTQCANWPGIRGTRAATDCLTQRQYNQIVEKTLSAKPTARPAASPAAGATPAGGAPATAPPGQTRPAVPLPTPPAPSRPPR
ncbi:MAG TPA: hypothetical protein VGC96_04245 [Candidatus Elarobacter sp.]